MLEMAVIFLVNTSLCTDFICVYSFKIFAFPNTFTLLLYYSKETL